MDRLIVAPGATTAAPEDDHEFCQACIVLDGFVDLQEKFGGAHVADVHLGRRSELQSRAAQCPLCKSLLSLADRHVEDTSGYCRPVFQIDYDFSAHFFAQPPHLRIAFGTVPTSSRDSSDRREHLAELGLIWLFSPKSESPESTAAWPAGRPRLFDPAQLDPSLIRDWLKQCDSCHGDKCKTPNTWTVAGDVRPSFIDIDLECIATPEQDVEYVALSYVWGPVETMKATLDNIQELRKPGSLSVLADDIVPATIRDAMTLCALVGQRYLWVDRVCIVQDDYQTKPEHLRAMAETYGKAVFTIVAADGSHANHGLCGMGQSVEERKSHLVPFPSRTMLRGTGWSAGKTSLDQTVWSERAWTFQEHIFSRRLLYFEKLVNWICFSARWTESWEPPASTRQFKEEDNEAAKGGKMYALDWPSLTEYTGMVEQFNQRQLRFDADVMDSFAGVTRQMGTGFPAGFFGGLPEFYFTTCLLWQARHGLRPRFNQPETSHLPSWSWMGWAGRLDLAMWTDNADAPLPAAEFPITISPVVQFFKDPARTTRVDDTFSVVRNHFKKDPPPPLPHGWQKNEGGDVAAPGSQPYYTYHGYYGKKHFSPSVRFPYPIPPFQRPRDIRRAEEEMPARDLYFTAQHATFNLGERQRYAQQRTACHANGTSYSAVDMPLVAFDGSWAGSVRLNMLERETISPGTQCTLIRVAEGSAPVRSINPMNLERLKAAQAAGRGLQLGHPFPDCVEREEVRDQTSYEFFFVLWIEWEGGFARRKALGTVWRPAWERAEPREIDVVLR